jgi:catechol 2,3-dioxygenase-like lactoylglutathione lyase family enzyme
MSGFRVQAVDHVDVTTPVEIEPDVVAWYASCLGLEQIDKPDGTRSEGAWFRAGSQQIHVTLDEHNPPKTAHFALVVDDFSAAVEKMREHGCHIEQARPIPGRHRCFTRDPAGNRIEIMSYDGEAHD